VRKSARWVAKADALCQPRVAAVPEQVMGSVSITIFGNTCFASLGRHTKTAHALRDSAVASKIALSVLRATISRRSPVAAAD